MFLINLLNDLEVAKQERDDENKEELKTLQKQTDTNQEIISLLKKKKVNLNMKTETQSKQLNQIKNRSIKA